MRARSIPILGLVVASCSDDANTRMDAPSGTADVPGGGPGLSGLLVGPNGQPIATTDVLACMATSCLYGESGADGRFVFSIEPPAEVALKTHSELARTPRLAAALEPIRIVDGVHVDAATLYVPDLPAGAMLGPTSADPQTLDAGDGLTLTLRRASLTPAIGEVLFDVAARKLPAERVPVYPELAGHTVLSVYALHPFGAKSSTPIGVRVPTTLADGTAVQLHAVSEIDGLLSAPVVGHAMSGFITSDANVGIERLTYLVVSQ